MSGVGGAGQTVLLCRLGGPQGRVTQRRHLGSQLRGGNTLGVRNKSFRLGALGRMTEKSPWVLTPLEPCLAHGNYMAKAPQWRVWVGGCPLRPEASSTLCASLSSPVSPPFPPSPPPCCSAWLSFRHSRAIEHDVQSQL